MRNYNWLNSLTLLLAISVIYLQKNYLTKKQNRLLYSHVGGPQNCTQGTLNL